MIPPPCESAASLYRVGLIRFSPGRVLVFHVGVFGCSSRMNGKPSSPVLRGLGASDGARLLDPWDYLRVACHPGRTQEILAARCLFHESRTYRSVADGSSIGLSPWCSNSFSLRSE